MIITLHCGGMPFDCDTFQNQSLGGSESAAYYVAKELGAAGHKVTIFTNTENQVKAGNVRYQPSGQITEQFPLGENFHFYASQTPCDMMIIQRHPLAFNFKWASKVNVWWVHDLALHRTAGQVQSMLHNIDYVAVVSQYHKDQMCEVYGLKPDHVKVVRNGVDLSLFDTAGYVVPDEVNQQIVKNRKILTYTSRPERGLEHLVKPDGIMEQLGDDYHLFYCSYDNSPQHMTGYYGQLDQWAEGLANVTKLNPMNKELLAGLMRSSRLHVYPTQFEEVSCITAMECMAAGLPMVTTTTAALPETCKNSGTILLKDESEFVNKIKNLKNYDDLVSKQLKAAKRFTWSSVASRFESLFLGAKYSYSDMSLVKHLVEMSDICALHRLLAYTEIDRETARYRQLVCSEIECDAAREYAENQINTYYSKLLAGDYAGHYAEYYDHYEVDKGVQYGPEDLSGNPRFCQTAHQIKDILEGREGRQVVIDYGCAHGHYTNNLAKLFKDVDFIGVDISQSNIDIARKWARDDGIDNVTFMRGEATHYDEWQKLKPSLEFDNIAVILACEVLEHVCNPEDIVNRLNELSTDETTFFLSTPYGPWEAIGYADNSMRAHLIHFERTDISEMLEAFEDVKILALPSGHDKRGQALGSYLTTFNGNPEHKCNSVDYDAKLSRTIPYRQTVSACMIVKDAEESIFKTLNSIKGVVDEVIISLDETTTDKTAEMIERWSEQNPFIPVQVFSGKSPTETDFSSVRNEVTKRARFEWVFWPDSDESLNGAESLTDYLKNSMLDGCLVKLIHYSAEPPQVMKVDLPSKLFRNGMGIQFYGCVHEHPEVEINKAIPHSAIVQGASLSHFSYTDETTRRGKFARNLPLLLKDREKYPNRMLGTFLYLRDLAQMNGYELEVNGMSEAVHSRCVEGIELFESMVDDEEFNTRMIIDGLDFYSSLVGTIGPAYECDYSLNFSKHGDQGIEEPKHVKFHDSEFCAKVIDRIVQEKTRSLTSKYF